MYWCNEQFCLETESTFSSSLFQLCVLNFSKSVHVSYCGNLNYWHWVCFCKLNFSIWDSGHTSDHSKCPVLTLQYSHSNSTEGFFCSLEACSFPCYLLLYSISGPPGKSPISTLTCLCKSHSMSKFTSQYTTWLNLYPLPCKLLSSKSPVCTKKIVTCLMNE